MLIEIWGILLLAFYALNLIRALDNKQYIHFYGIVINIIFWLPFVGRTYGWW